LFVATPKPKISEYAGGSFYSENSKSRNHPLHPSFQTIINNDLCRCVNSLCRCVNDLCCRLNSLCRCLNSLCCRVNILCRCVNDPCCRLNSLCRCLNSLCRCLNSLCRCVNNLCCRLNSLCRCLNDLCCRVNSLCSCVNDLCRCLNDLCCRVNSLCSCNNASPSEGLSLLHPDASGYSMGSRPPLLNPARCRVSYDFFIGIKHSQFVIGKLATFPHMFYPLHQQ
jgi:hypothetical protein